MQNNFWEKLNKPFYALAPMYDVTDAAFRYIIAKYGKPDVFYTEFVSTEGLQSAGREKLLHHLKLNDIEHPVVAQVFGTNPEKFYQTALLVKDLGFDGMDINMGCPDKNVIKTGSCAALFKTPELAKEIVLASKEARIPISVKIRIGDSKIDWQPWISKLLEAKPEAIAVHLRTRSEMSKVPAHWELMPAIVAFIKQHYTEQYKPKIIGNGDIENLHQAQEKINTTGCDGVMIGRGIFGNPWLFDQSKTLVTQDEKISVLKEHIALYHKLFNGIKPFDIMKRHFKAYIHGFDGAGELRANLYEAKSAEEALDILNKV